MDANTIVTLISSLGFPICMVIFMCWFIVRTMDSHKEETLKLTEAVNNNTMVIQRLVDKMEVIANDK